MRRVTLAAAIALTAASIPATALADGLPVPMDGFGTTSIVKPDGEGPRYATVRAGTDTELLRIDQDGGEITGTRGIDGNYTVPLVALDGTPAGLSADGRTLALIAPRTDYRFPRDETSFLILDVAAAGPMRVRDRITLRGDFSFDALSPDGRTMYLVEYLSRDYNDYAVREYDLRATRLLPEPVLVAHEVEPSEMRGLPLTRATSSDGRWEYTLYDGGGGRADDPFIHTLDTERGISHCIDLAMVDGREAWRVDLALSGDEGSLDVVRGDSTLARLDTETFALSELAPTAESGTGGEGGPAGWAVGALAAGLAAAVGTALGLRRRRLRAAMPADPFGPDATESEARPEAERERAGAPG